jgi:hypothetical protein
MVIYPTAVLALVLFVVGLAVCIWRVFFGARYPEFNRVKRRW